MIKEDVSPDLIREMLSEEGFDVSPATEEGTFQVRELESGLTITCVLQENILFNTLPCFSLAKDRVSLELTRKMLDAENGLSTSFFQLYERPDGTVLVALNNFCKLQDLGAEDKDDILSCLSFLEVDAVTARQLLADFA